MSQIIALYECDDFKSYASMRPLMLTHSWYKLVRRLKKEVKKRNFESGGNFDELITKGVPYKYSGSSEIHHRNLFCSEGIEALNNDLRNCYISICEDGDDLRGIF